MLPRAVPASRNCVESVGRAAASAAGAGNLARIDAVLGGDPRHDRGDERLTVRRHGFLGVYRLRLGRGLLARSDVRAATGCLTPLRVCNPVEIAPLPGRPAIARGLRSDVPPSSLPALPVPRPSSQGTPVALPSRVVPLQVKSGCV